MDDIILSGERFQQLCDVYCGSHYDLHRNPKIAAQPAKHMILDTLTQQWDNPRIIFCYSCALSTFMSKLHLLTNPFILVSHNEDNNVTEQFLPIAEHPLLIHWFAQNVMMRHEKITWIPIGIANEMWPHGRVSMFLQTCANLTSFPKQYDVFFNFSLHTNPSARALCHTTLTSKGLTFTPQLPLSSYLPVLASHKYVICPPGNGVDCHRIWETIMVGGIPILLRSVFTELIAQEIPCILLDSWNDFSMEQLHTEYPQLAAKLSQLHKSGRLLFSTLRETILSKMHNQTDIDLGMIIAYTFIGPLPSYAVDTVHQLRLFYDGPVYFTINDYDSPIANTLQEKYNVTIVRYDTVADEFFTHTVNQFKHKFCIVESLKGREKLFIYAFERFFLLYNLMVQQNLSNVFFMELDNLVYDDPRHWKAALATKDMAFMFDHHDRGASGVCFLRSPTTLRKFCDESLQFIQTSSEFINEMTVLYRFWQKNRDDIFLMPIHWTDSSVPAEACANFDKFSHTIFDAASIGIYLGGMDPHHTGGVIQYKLKGKWSAVDYTNYTFTWKEDSQGRRIPYVWGAGKFIKINNLHIHSKLLAPLLSNPIQKAEVVPSIDNHKIPGVIPVVMGGLGNQMFIVAAAFVAGKRNGYPVYLLENALENNKHNHLKQNYNDTIFKHMGVRIPIVGKSAQFAQFVRHYGYIEHNQRGFQPWHPEDVRSGSVMSSYYQFYPALEPYESDLRKAILEGLQPYRDAFKGRDLTRCAFLHIRRGDYLDTPHIHYIQQTEYYETCVMQLLGTVGFQGLQTIYVLSDDMDWVRSQPFFQNSLFTLYDSKDELMTLGLMSLCKAGAICANSTFSWWGAFLGAHGARAPVFVPKRWIGGDDLPVALFPDEWHRV